MTSLEIPRPIGRREPALHHLNCLPISISQATLPRLLRKIITSSAARAMLPFDDPRWRSYTGGYRDPYDASAPLRQLLEQGASPSLWSELWQELFHQGDIGPASLAAVPWLLEYIRRSPELDWNAFGLIAVIELERPHHCNNWPMPSELADSYLAAVAQVPEVAACHAQKQWSPILTQHIAACIALSRGQRLLARAYLDMDGEGAVKWLADGMGFDEREVQRWAHE
jgi:hypothetical protein